LPFGIFYGHLVYFMAFCFLWPFGIFSPVLVYFPPFWYFSPRKIWQPWLDFANVAGIERSR
jgi:hypothetical protein